MSGTITVTALSDAEIKRNAGEDGPYRIRCARNNDLRFQYATSDRGRGSWYLRHNSKWQKFAEWPQIPSRVALQLLQEARERLAGGSAVAVDRFATVGDLLRWYGDRVAKDRSLTAKRKNGVRSMIDVQLMPRIAGMRISEVNRSSIDEQLMWPLQTELSVSYSGSCMRVLKMAFTRAVKLDLIEANPMADMRFTDFVEAKIKPKPASLNMLDLPDLLEKLTQTFHQNKTINMIALMMLAHGTRIGETRQAQWRHVCLQQKVWVIPAANTKTRTEHVLPLTDRMCELLTIYREAMGSRYSKSGPMFLQGYTDKAITEQSAFAGFRSLSGGLWSSHDLRKLARTGWVELGVDYLIGEMLLNHGMSLMAETYINTSADELKLDALTRWHERLDSLGLASLRIDIEAAK
ncbi:MAG TPA: integrase [Pseudomonas sp.]|nr:integrase [Pseudomonas sp.]